MRSNIRPLNELIYELKHKRVYEINRYSQSKKIIPESIEKFACLSDPAYINNQGKLRIKNGKEFVTLGYV
jgi:hypothetical protein